MSYKGKSHKLLLYREFSFTSVKNLNGFSIVPVYFYLFILLTILEIDEVEQFQLFSE